MPDSASVIRSPSTASSSAEMPGMVPCSELPTATIAVRPRMRAAECRCPTGGRHQIASSSASSSTSSLERPSTSS